MEKQERTKRAKNGERTQKMFSFRLDKENADWLQGVQNKGRLINELLKRRQMEEKRFRNPTPEKWDEDEQPDARFDYQV